MQNRQLTLKQERFVANYLQTGNALQSAISAGYAKNTAIVKSSKWLEKGRIKQAIDAKRQEIQENTQITVNKQVKRANEVYEKALASNHYTAALTANDQLNRHIGFYNADISGGLNILDIMAVVGINVEKASERPVEGKTG